MNYLVIVAGGRGQRIGLGFNKIFAKIGEFPLLYWTIMRFEKSKVVDKIVISASEEDIEKIKKFVKKYNFKKVKDIIKAQATRQESTYAILKAWQSKFKNSDLVGVHNAANPFVAADEIKKVFSAAKRYGAALLAQPARDTVKITNGDGRVIETPIRKYSWYAQTPQVATLENLYKAHIKAKKDGFIGTDDSQLLERIGIKPKIVSTSNQNFKITYKEDLIMANYLLKTWVE